MSNFCPPVSILKGWGRVPLICSRLHYKPSMIIFLAENTPAAPQGLGCGFPAELCCFLRIHNTPRAALYSLHIGAGRAYI